MQGPDLRVVCNPRTEIEDGESRGGVVTNRREDGLQKHPERCPGNTGSEHHQPEAKKPVGLTDGFRTQHANVHTTISKHQNNRHIVGALVEESTRAAEALCAIPKG
jgi:hypothetical protein